MDGWEPESKMFGWLGARIKDGWIVGSKDKGCFDGWEQNIGYLDGWEQESRMIGWLGARIKDGWMFESKD